MTQLPGLRVSPASTRSLLALEVAEELVDKPDWPYVRALVVMKGGDFQTEGFTLFGSGSPDGSCFV